MKSDYLLGDKPSGESLDFILRPMINAYPSLPKSAFIQSCYFQKLLYLYSSEKTFNPGDTWCDFDHFSSVFHDSYNHSCQNAVLCGQFAQLLILENKSKEAKKLLTDFKLNRSPKK
jgi:hypothetical protein